MNNAPTAFQSKGTDLADAEPATCICEILVGSLIRLINERSSRRVIQSTIDRFWMLLRMI